MALARVPVILPASPAWPHSVVTPWCRPIISCSPVPGSACRVQRATLRQDHLAFLDDTDRNTPDFEFLRIDSTNVDSCCSDAVSVCAGDREGLARVPDRLQSWKICPTARLAFGDGLGRMPAPASTRPRR